MPNRRGFLAHAFTAFGVGVFGTGRKALASPAPRQDSSPFLGRNPGDERTVEGMKLCWCPPGQFVMGSPPTETGRNADEAQVPVTITRGFWMAKFEVTQGHWTRVMGALPKTPPTAEFGLGDEYPVYWVSYGDAETFCRTLTEGARRAGALPDGWEFRLPTEAQWEYACRAGTVTATAFGDSLGLRQANFNGEPLKAGEGGNGTWSCHIRWQLSGQSVGPLRHARQCLRVVPRLVSRAVAWRNGSGSLGDERTAEPGRNLFPRPARRRLERFRQVLSFGVPAALRARTELRPHRLSRRRGSSSWKRSPATCRRPRLN